MLDRKKAVRLDEPELLLFKPQNRVISAFGIKDLYVDRRSEYFRAVLRADVSTSTGR